MITCPCGSTDWKAEYKDVLDPANDKFRCLKCTALFKRYDVMDRWDQFWNTVQPGTVFQVASERGVDLLIFMKPSDSRHIDRCLFHFDFGTIHHYSEYFLFENGLEPVLACMLTKE